MIMFGGGRASIKLDDVWAYDPTPTPGPSSPRRALRLPLDRGAAMAYDSASRPDRSCSEGSATVVACFSDTWAYDSSKNRWTELNSETHPIPRVYLCMTYDPSTERVIMFGGLDRWGARSDTWVCTP